MRGHVLDFSAKRSSGGTAPGREGQRYAFPALADDSD